MLEEEELAAVIHHERFHQMSLDPLRCFIMGLLTSVLWFLPILQWQNRYYRIAREVLADRYAILVLGSERALGSALLKLIKCGKPPVFVAAVSFADTSVNYRIHQLLNPHEEVMPVPPRGPMLLSVPVGVMMIGIYGVGLF
jgi:beta-lactamase regulating signal transducer with metallopeptidase domain